MPNSQNRFFKQAKKVLSSVGYVSASSLTAAGYGALHGLFAAEFFHPESRNHFTKIGAIGGGIFIGGVLLLAGLGNKSIKKFIETVLLNELEELTPYEYLQLAIIFSLMSAGLGKAMIDAIEKDNQDPNSEYGTVLSIFLPIGIFLLILSTLLHVSYYSIKPHLSMCSYNNADENHEQMPPPEDAFVIDMIDDGQSTQTLYSTEAEAEADAASYLESDISSERSVIL